MADEPTIGELKRLIERNHLEVREDYLAIKGELERFVLEKVYQAEKIAFEARFTAIEKEQERTRSTRLLMATLAVTAFLAPIVVGVVVFWVTRSLR